MKYRLLKQTAEYDSLRGKVSRTTITFLFKLKSVDEINKIENELRYRDKGNHSNNIDN